MQRNSPPEMRLLCINEGSIVARCTETYLRQASRRFLKAQEQTLCTQGSVSTFVGGKGAGRVGRSPLAAPFYRDVLGLDVRVRTACMSGRGLLATTNRCPGAPGGVGTKDRNSSSLARERPNSSGLRAQDGSEAVWPMMRNAVPPSQRPENPLLFECQNDQEEQERRGQQQQAAATDKTLAFNNCQTRCSRFEGFAVNTTDPKQRRRRPANDDYCASSTGPLSAALVPLLGSCRIPGHSSPSPARDSYEQVH